MTNPVIDNIRRSLGRTVQITSPQGAPLSPHPAIYQSRQAGTTGSEIQLFLDELNKLSGVGQRLAPSGIAEALKTLVAEKDIHKATVWDTPHLQQLQITEHLAALGVELISPIAEKHEMALCDLGITEADYLLPETGTIVLHSSAEMPRAVSLLPRIHLAIVRPEMLRPDMHQVFSEAKGSNYLVFVTGPSRTADIELTTTLGVHGPKELFVWILEGEN
jgi:L-lactate dehydrogenase complex protein LldG